MAMLTDRKFAHVHFDISWSEVAKYVVATPEILRRCAALMNRHPDRFLFGTDEVAPKDQASYLRVFEQYKPLWSLLDEAASEKVRRGNYERLFDAARGKVRAWEAAHVK